MASNDDESMTLGKALSILESKFLLLLKNESASNIETLFYQLEKAGWYYVDFLQPKYGLPLLKGFQVAERLFKFSNAFKNSVDDFETLRKKYGSYKSHIPVCGCIPINSTCTKILLCRVIDGDTWMFPRGKINKDESFHECAIRETYEETGLNMSSLVDEKDYFILQTCKPICMFIAANAPEDFSYAPICRGEISEIRFFPIDDLPKQTFCVVEFIPFIKKWISSFNRKSSKDGKYLKNNNLIDSKLSNNGSSVNGSNSGNESLASVFNKRNDTTFGVGKQSSGWSVAEMFASVEKNTGSSMVYNGKPQEFGNQHPRYVDYNSINSFQSAVEGNRIIKIPSIDFGELSETSREFDDQKREEKSRTSEGRETPSLSDKESALLLDSMLASKVGSQQKNKKILKRVEVGNLLSRVGSSSEGENSVSQISRKNVTSLLQSLISSTANIGDDDSSNEKKISQNVDLRQNEAINLSHSATKVATPTIDHSEDLLVDLRRQLYGVC